MAQQDGIVKMKGSVGDLSFYKKKGEYYVRKKSGVSGDRIKSDPAFKRTRENMAEFKYANQSSALLRIALSELIKRNKFYRMATRMNHLFGKILRTDSVSARGLRRVSNGDISLLQGFNFNVEALLPAIFKPLYEVVTDREAGTITVSVGEFIPETMVDSPEQATHLRLTLAGVEIDFATEEFQTKLHSSGDVLLDLNMNPGFELSVALTPNSDKVWLGILGLEFFQEVNGVMYMLRVSSHNAMRVIVADKV